MNRTIALLLAPVALCLTATPAAAQNEEADLDTIASVVAPPAILAGLVLGGCEETYRKRLQSNPQEAELEARMPGVHERMVAAMSTQCRTGIVGAVRQLHSRVKEEWRTRETVADRARLARLMKPLADNIASVRIEFLPGETATAAARRLNASTNYYPAGFRQVEARFAQTPGGLPLLQRMYDYGEKRTAELMRSPDSALMALMEEGKRKSRVAANDYARESGQQVPFPGE